MIFYALSFLVGAGIGSLLFSLLVANKICELETALYELEKKLENS